LALQRITFYVKIMNTNLFQGQLVRFTAPNPKTDPEVIARWWRDSEYGRLQDSDPAFPRTAAQLREGMERGPDDDGFFFHFRPLDEERLLGFVGLWVDWRNRDAWLGIGIGNREDWGKGYGSDAMRLAVRYAFTELGLHRVSLTVLGSNPRAQRAYEKAGFVVEGRQRGLSHYDGQRVDEVYMGILRDEWERIVKPEA
jgi:RimJ/RimL family protein N-acetyltransferase